jgi:hypothetical protein
MASHSSAPARKQAPHGNRTTRTNTILNALTQRAQAVLNNNLLDAQSRAILQYALEKNDPGLAELVRRADEGETIVETASEDDPSRGKIQALTEMICRNGGESAAALLVLMATMQDAPDPKVIAHTVKHHAFTCCGEFNVFGIVDTQIAMLERELFADNTLAWFESARD